MIIAGNETTTKLLGNALYWLWRNPEQRDAWSRRIRALIPRWVEETLRYDGSTQALARTVDRATSSCTASACATATASCCWSARRTATSASFRTRTRYDIQRDTNAMLSFGQGTHFCLGAALARLEARVALEEVQRRFRDFEVDPSGIARVHSVNVRGFAALPITFTPSTPEAHERDAHGGRDRRVDRDRRRDRARARRARVVGRARRAADGAARGGARASVETAGGARVRACARRRPTPPASTRSSRAAEARARADRRSGEQRRHRRPGSAPRGRRSPTSSASSAPICSGPMLVTRRALPSMLAAPTRRPGLHLVDERRRAAAVPARLHGREGRPRRHGAAYCAAISKAPASARRSFARAPTRSEFGFGWDPEILVRVDRLVEGTGASCATST